MFIAMNRFRIAPGKEQDFIEVWKNRDSQLDSVAGFKNFNLLQGPADDTATIFISHSSWDSEQAFIDWTDSEAFRQAHAHAGSKTKDIYLGPPQFEGYNKVL